MTLRAWRTGENWRLCHYVEVQTSHVSDCVCPESALSLSCAFYSRPLLSPASTRSPPLPRHYHLHLTLSPSLHLLLMK